LDYYQQAIEQQPDYAQAYVAIARAWSFSDAPEALPNEKAAIAKALTLEPDLPEAHLFLGDIASHEWNWSQAEQEYKRALQSNPNSATAHHSYGDYLDAMGRLEEGMHQYQLAQQLDPGTNHLIGALLNQHQYQKAAETLQNADAGDWATHFFLAIAYERLGKTKETIAEDEEALKLLGYTDLAESIRRTYLASGYRAATLRIAKLTEDGTKNEGWQCWTPAYYYAVLDDRDRAFEWLETCYKEHDAELMNLRVDPTWENIRSDPRFTDLVRGVGLPS
jgi:tetratricopeptide (TPR) repeat protein